MAQNFSHIKKGDSNKKISPLVIMVAVLAVAVAVLAGIYFAWEKPPEIAEEPEPVRTAPPAPTLSPEELEEIEDSKIVSQAPELKENTKREGIYTILLAGIDDAAYLTDTILVGFLDTVNHEMNFLSIPRDTITVGGTKINEVYYGANRDTGSMEPGVKALMDQVSNIIGYQVDCYAFIDISVFVDVIDAIGGVWFDVPVNVEYIDQAHDYWVFQRAGYYHLDGKTAMGVVRFRESYPRGDLDRIETQHAFLKTVADQCLSLGKIPHMKKVLDIISRGTQTDLTRANIAFFMRQALLCSSENIRFMTLPAHNTFWNDSSYAVIEEWNWCEMLNQYFNPFEDVTYFPQSLNIIVDVEGRLVYALYPYVPFG